MDELEDLQTMYEENKADKIAALKVILGEKAKILKELSIKKDQIAFELGELNKELLAIQDAIRSLWLPHIAGAEKASINCDGIILEMLPKLNIGVDKEDESARDKALGWLAANGYKDVMRWDVNTNKMYAIARENYKDGEGTPIPGLKYSYFQLIKIK